MKQSGFKEKQRLALENTGDTSLIRVKQGRNVLHRTELRRAEIGIKELSKVELMLNVSH